MGEIICSLDNAWKPIFVHVMNGQPTCAADPTTREHCETTSIRLLARKNERPLSQAGNQRKQPSDRPMAKADKQDAEIKARWMGHVYQHEVLNRKRWFHCAFVSGLFWKVVSVGSRIFLLSYTTNYYDGRFYHNSLSMAYPSTLIIRSME